MQSEKEKAAAIRADIRWYVKCRREDLQEIRFLRRDLERMKEAHDEI